MKTKLIISTLWLAATLTACAKQSPPPSPNLMVMMTEAKGGMIDASFLTVSDLENCEERVAAAKAVFPIAKIVYVEHYCAYSDINFASFDHAPETTGPAYYLAVKFSKDGKVLKSVKKFDNEEDCKKTKVGMCIVSNQDVVE